MQNGSRKSAVADVPRSRCPIRKLSVSDADHATLSVPCPPSLFAIAVSALVGGFFGRSALATDDKVPEHYKTFTAALSAIEASYVDKVESDRLVYGAIRGMLAHARSALELLRPARIRADARAAGRPLLRPRHHDSGDRRRHHRAAASSKDRRRTRRASAAATSSRRSTAKTPRAGPPSRRCSKLRGPKGTPVQIDIRRRGYDELIPLERDARRSQHPDRARVLHDRRDDRLHPAARLRREHRSRRAARAARPRRRRA